jgi:hypothetical protein
MARRQWALGRSLDTANKAANANAKTAPLMALPITASIVGGPRRPGWRLSALFYPSQPGFAGNREKAVKLALL